MSRRDRMAFLRQLLHAAWRCLCLVYFFLTAYRDFRDNYAVDVLKILGYGDRRACSASPSRWWGWHC